MSCNFATSCKVQDQSLITVLESNMFQFSFFNFATEKRYLLGANPVSGVLGHPSIGLLYIMSQGKSFECWRHQKLFCVSPSSVLLIVWLADCWETAAVGWIISRCRISAGRCKDNAWGGWTPTQLDIATQVILQRRHHTHPQDRFVYSNIVKEGTDLIIRTGWEGCCSWVDRIGSSWKTLYALRPIRYTDV